MQYLKSEDWQTIFKKYPRLQGEIASINVGRELTALKNELKHQKEFLCRERVSWLESRIEELEVAGVKEL